MPCDPRYTTVEGLAKLVFSAISGHFRWVRTHDFRVPGGFRCPMTLGTRLYKDNNNRVFGHFWLFSRVLTHDFRVLGGFR